MSQPIPPSPDQIRDAIERLTKPTFRPSIMQAADEAIVLAAARAFAEHMEKQPANLGELDQFGGPRPKTISVQEEQNAFMFIHKMSGMWSRTNPGAVAEDMRSAGYVINHIDAPAPKHENVPDRFDRIEAMLLRYTDSFGARLAKADEEAALNLTATDTRMDRLSGIIDEYEKRFANHNERLRNIQDRVTEVEKGPQFVTITDPTNRHPLPRKDG